MGGISFLFAMYLARENIGYLRSPVKLLPMLVFVSCFNPRYTSGTPLAARALVDETMNCDDILLNVAVSNYTGRPPVFVQTSGVRVSCFHPSSLLSPYSLDLRILSRKA